MPDLVSLDKILYDNNIEVDGRNRASIIRRCQELGRNVYLDFGRSSKLDCVIGVWDDEDGNKLTEKFGTPNTPCQIFEKDLDSLASAIEQGDLVTALKNIHCYFGTSAWCVILEVIQPHPTMTLKVDRAPGLTPTPAQKALDKILRHSVEVGWMESNSNQGHTQKWKFLKADTYLYAFLFVLRERDLIDDKNAFIRQFLSRRETPFEQCLAIPKDETVKKDYYRIASDLVDSVG